MKKTGVAVLEDPANGAPFSVTAGVVDAAAAEKMILPDSVLLPLRSGMTPPLVPVGISAVTIERRATAPVEPFGVARNWFAVCPVAKVSPSVPDVVIGDPDTENTDGTVRVILVTVPLPLPQANPASARLPVELLNCAQCPLTTDTGAV